MDPILVDTYAGDFAGKPPLDKMLAWPACCGISLKATEGTYYKARQWFGTYWTAARHLAGDRYGVSWFRMAYHYLKFDQVGALQADYFLQAIDEAGGWGPGDLPASVDVELGGDHDSNRKASKQQIIDCTSGFAERYKGATGRPLILYGIGAMLDHGITSRMGCDLLWIPRYDATLPRQEYEECGWDVESLFGWQYTGTEPHKAALAGYPLTIPGTNLLADLTAVQVKDLAELCGTRVAA